jgi:hypothetical protein
MTLTPNLTALILAMFDVLVMAHPTRTTTVLLPLCHHDKTVLGDM